MFGKYLLGFSNIVYTLARNKKPQNIRDSLYQKQSKKIFLFLLILFI